ncbi:MAG TPA: hypothetical protein VGQ59_01575 [Cyclobacteriaceae bacterium]|jgi:hypothetical protein|nr:hypothetical protein [Cyclobacteriaceae bacterium]
MTFAQNNDDIIKQYKTVKGLTQKARRQDYESRIQQELRSRVAAELQRQENRWQVKEIYKEVITLFFEFELEYFFMSIYFDDDDDYLIHELLPVLSSPTHKPLNYEDRYSLLKLLYPRETASGRVKEFLGKLFYERIGFKALRAKDMSNEFPEINHVTSWIQKQLEEENGADNVSFALFHFTKFWQMRYAKPFNETAGIVFLVKMQQKIEPLGSDRLKVNFGKVLETLVKEMTKLIVKPVNSPISNLVNSSLIDHSVHAGYLKRIDEFQRLLQEKSMIFQNLTELAVSELFARYCDTSSQLQAVFSKEILMRFGRGQVLSTQEIDNFRAIDSSSLSAEGNQLYNKIRSINYIFF